MSVVFRPLSRFVGIVLLVTALPLAAAGQSAAESDLLARLARQPADVSVLLDLAKLYTDQRRFDEALAMTQRASTAIRAQQTAAGTRMMTNGAVFTPIQVTMVPPASPVNAATAPTQVARVKVGGAITEPRKIHDVKPVYPEVAQAARVQGIVIIEAILGVDGSVVETTVLRGVSLLDEAALDAVRQWRFTPTLLNGMPVEVVMTVTVNFTLSSGSRDVNAPVSASASAPVRVGGDIREPRRLKDVRPDYPDVARAAGVQGVVILELIVDEQGRVAEARALRGNPLLLESAVEAARQWEFEPTYLNGTAVRVAMTVTVSFSLK